MVEAVKAPQRIQEQSTIIHGPESQSSQIALNELINEATDNLNIERLQAHSVDMEAYEKALDETDLEDFDELIQQMHKQINNETLQQDLSLASPEQLEQLHQDLQVLDPFLNEQSEVLEGEMPSGKYRNVYSHMVEFYSLVNKTLIDLKATNNLQKRDDKEDVKKNQADKTRYTWFQCAIEMISGGIAGCMSATSEFGRVAAEFGVSKVAAGANAVLHDKSGRKEHTVQTLDKKQDSARDRNQGLGRLDQEILRNLSEAMRSHQRTLTDRNING